jgi:hypothetical protein
MRSFCHETSILFFLFGRTNSFFFLLWKKISDALGAGIGAVFSLQGERPAKLSSQLKELAASCIDIGKDEGRYIVHPTSILD